MTIGHGNYFQAVDRLGDDAALGVLTTSGREREELTHDRARVLAAIDRFEGREPRIEVSGGIPMATVNEPSAVGPGEAPRKDLTDPREIPRLELFHVSTERPMFSPRFPRPGVGMVGVPFDSETTMSVLRDAARLLGLDDGRRKAFVWISSGLPYGAGGLSLAVSAMRQSGVVTYVLDPLTGHGAVRPEWRLR